MRDVEGDARGESREQRRLRVRVEGEPEPGVHQHPEREAEHEHEGDERESPAQERPQEAGEEAATAPRQHLPGRVRALAEEEVRRDRRERADREPATRAERDSGRGDDDRHGLDARDRGEEDTSRGRKAAERGDERQVARGHRPAFEPGEAGREHGEGGEQRRDPAVGRIERRPGGERERSRSAEARRP